MAIDNNPALPLTLSLVVSVFTSFHCSKGTHTEVPFANLAPEVKYVGSSPCTSCHREISESYAKSEMGRSTSRLDEKTLIEKFPQTYTVYDSLGDYYYEMLQLGQEFYQREYRIDKNGKVVHERMVRADYVMGSGNNLRMYFHDENGMLYELPLTWYVYKQRWSLSPGYRDFQNLRFSRYAGPQCISCHNSYLELSATAKDRYMKPYSLGIGCERCHGPGELHVRQALGEKLDGISQNRPTIVNPAKLPPQERLDVCQQCHLQGKAWVLRTMDDWFGYRPGLKLETHRSVYVPERTLREVIEVADSPQRLAMSQCFRQSSGTLTCITCHNPHFSIKTFSAEHYNSKCLGCHSIESLPTNGSQTPHKRSDNCISCHMNRTGTDNTLHGVSNTDHWIRINADKTVIDWSLLRRRPEEGSEVMLVPFVDAKNDGSTLRRGIAYLYYFNEHDNRKAYLDSALAYLLSGLKQTSQDHQGYFALGQVQAMLGEYEQAITSFARSLSLNPNYGDALYELARAYSAFGKKDSAIEFYRAALTRLPDEPSYLESLGLALASQGRTREATEILRRSLTIDTQSYLAYLTLGNLYALALQDPRRSVDLYKVSLVLEPDAQDIHVNLGNAYVLTGEYEKALHEYALQIEKWPGTAEAFVNMGRVYMLRGDMAKARESFMKALKTSPGLEIARALLESISQE